MPEDLKEAGIDDDSLFGKADILERFIAKFIDLLIVGALCAFPTLVGWLAGTTYILISDGLRGGQSAGKMIIGLRTVSDSGAPCDFRKSIIRNSVFGGLMLVYLIVGWIPYIGKPVAFVAWVAVAGAEMALVYADEAGKRFGDRIAGTRVVPGKVAVRIP